MKIPEKIASVEELEWLLSEPHPALIEMMKRLDGDIVILGVAGKTCPFDSKKLRYVSRSSSAVSLFIFSPHVEEQLYHNLVLAMATAGGQLLAQAA